MNAKTVNKILRDVDYIRTGGSEEELKAANYMKEMCESMGVSAHLEDFPVQMAEIKNVHLYADGTEYACTGYKNCGSWDIEADFLYVPAIDEITLSQAKGKIILVDGGFNYQFEDILKAGVAGLITYNGNVNFTDSDIDQKELRGYVAKGRKLPAANMNAKEAFRLVKAKPKKIHLVIEQEEWEGNSRNVVAELPGLRDEWIVMTAHYDSVPLSRGAYDNLTGAIALLGAIDEFRKKAPMNYGLRFVFCGSEERGLLGAKAYVRDHEAELDKIALNVNIDMIGTYMGKFLACVSAEDALVTYISYMAKEQGFSTNAYSGVYSSDSTPFAYAGVPALSFARLALDSQAPIHNRYDTAKVLSSEQILKDIHFINGFVKRMASAELCPVSRDIPETVKKRLDNYINLTKQK